MDLHGIHHLTAITGDVNRNHAFYTRDLGLRLVKKSVNQDDVSAYHLFYADAKGSPGTDLTFFDWNIPPERRGTHSITRIGLRVSGEESLKWWTDHLTQHGVAHGGPVERDGRSAIEFEDFEGQRLTLVDDGGKGGTAHAWSKSPVPPEHQIRGLGPITISVPDIRRTEPVLIGVMNMRRVRGYGNLHVYEMGGGVGAANAGPANELHVAVESDLPFARQGAGGVHHVAFRVPDEAQYHAWAERLNSLGIANSGEIDRYYFRSLYFREPNGILFELATDGPGFATDESEERLGERLALPPFLEPQRARIEANLKPLR